MKIFIAGSMSFAKEIIEIHKVLSELGFESKFAPDTYDCFNNPYAKLNEDLEHCERMDIIRSCMQEQEQCDAILLLNYPKDGIDGYIGPNCLIELGVAYYLKQRIFLLYAPPPPEQARYHIEVMHMKPIILKGSIKDLRRYLQVKAADEVLPKPAVNLKLQRLVPPEVDIVPRSHWEGKEGQGRRSPTP